VYSANNQKAEHAALVGAACHFRLVHIARHFCFQQHERSRGEPAVTGKLDPRSVALLPQMHPDLRKVVLRASEIAPFGFRLTEVLRTLERQKQLLAIGATTTLRSRHLPHPKDGLSRAFDVVPMVDLDKDGRIETEEMYHWPLYHRLAPAMKQAAKDVGVPIEWGGSWVKFRDGPHWQLPWKSYP
jgi:peptidoglycan L-alanyl-D-glutamate endopeptidase CwlK